METVIDAAQPGAAESSPAEAFAVPSDPTEYAEWRQTGKLPEKKPPASAKEAPKESSETVPASEPGKKKQEPKRSAAQERLDEILADLKTAGLSPAELKTFKRELKQEPKPDATQPAPTPEKTSKPAETGRPQRPKADDPKFKTIEEYEQALDQYHEDLADFKAEQKVAQLRQEDQQRQAKAEMDAKVAAARQRYGEAAGENIKTAASAIFADKEIPGAVKALVDQSPVIADLMYVLGSKSSDLSELVALAKSDPGKAIRKIVLLEQLVTEELKTPAGAKDQPKGEVEGEKAAPGRDASGKFTAPAPEKKNSEAPPPPAEVSGRGTTPQDEGAQALKDHESGDGEAFRRYREAANRRDIERRRGR